MTSKYYRSRLISNLEHAVSLLENAYKLGLVSLKESVIIALRLAGEEFEEAKVDISQINSRRSMKLDPGDTQFPCDRCEDLFPTMLGLEKHARCHIGFTFACDQCEFVSDTSQYLRSHLKSKHRNTKGSR